MKDIEFTIRCAVVILAIMIAFLIMSSAVSMKETRAQRDLCIKAGGVFINGSDGDFCVKEFMPMKEAE
jgi:hypothetical protein